MHPQLAQLQTPGEVIVNHKRVKGGQRSTSEDLVQTFPQIRIQKEDCQYWSIPGFLLPK